MGKYFQPEIETASREEILAIQNEKIVKQVKHVYENVKYYRDLMVEKGLKPEDIKGVEDIKRTTSTFGRTAPQEQLSRRAAPRTTSFRFATGTVCSQAVRDCTAAPIRSAA